MTRFICWALALGLAVSFGPHLGAITIQAAQAAIHAHLHDQMSYAKFTRSLLSAKPRGILKKP